eukprot:1147694-Pelagomonas_calceolata.AAC.9
MMRIGGPQITLLASDRPQKGPQPHPRLFHFQSYVTVNSIHDDKILHIQKKEKGWSKSDLLGTLVPNYLQGKWLEFCTSPTTESSYSF